MATKKDPIGVALTAIESMNIMQLAELVSTLKEKFGITGPLLASQAAAAPQEAGAKAEEKAEEKSEFSVSLVGIGDKKIQVLKELRALTQLGLKEAKDLIDNTPSVIKEAVSKEEAEQIRSKLEQVGAKVEIK